MMSLQLENRGLLRGPLGEAFAAPNSFNGLHTEIDPRFSKNHHHLLNPVLPSADEVALQWRISDLRIALQVSESAQLKVEHEKEALIQHAEELQATIYGLYAEVNQLKYLLALDNKEAGEVKRITSMVTDSNQVTSATEAISNAHKAAVELSKVRWHASVLINSLQDEIERLIQEAAHSRILYNARGRQIQLLKEELKAKFSDEAAINQQSKSITRGRNRPMDRTMGDATLPANKHAHLQQEEVPLEATMTHYDQELQKVAELLGGKEVDLLSKQVIKFLNAWEYHLGLESEPCSPLEWQVESSSEHEMWKEE